MKTKYATHKPVLAVELAALHKFIALLSSLRLTVFYPPPSHLFRSVFFFFMRSFLPVPPKSTAATVGVDKKLPETNKGKYWHHRTENLEKRSESPLS